MARFSAGWFIGLLALLLVACVTKDPPSTRVRGTPSGEPPVHEYPLDCQQAPDLSHEGNLVLANEADVESALGITHVAGSLLVERTTLVSVELPALRSTEGELWIEMNDDLVEAAFPCLVEVGHDLTLQINEQMTGIQLPELERVGGSIHIVDHDLQALELPWLETVGRHVNLKVLCFEGFSWPSLTEIGGELSVSDNGPSFQHFEMPALRSVAGRVRIAYNPDLTTLSGLRALGSVGGNLTIEQNSSLPTCEAEALRDQIDAADGIGGSVNISNNDDSGMCR